MKNIAIILAGGSGSRLGGDRPKQLLPLSDGRSILEHSVDAFERASCIDEIAIVMHPDWINEAEGLCQANGWTKVKKVLAGGKERWESSWKAIEAFNGDRLVVSGERINLWFHDAARPWVSERIIADVAKALEENEAVTVAVKVTDTIYQVDRLGVSGERLVVDSIPPRECFMRAQTPQAFRIEVIEEAYQRALSAGLIEATDDCGIVKRWMPEQPIYIVEGEEKNKKITYKEDL